MEAVPVLITVIGPSYGNYGPFGEYAAYHNPRKDTSKVICSPYCADNKPHVPTYCFGMVNTLEQPSCGQFCTSSCRAWRLCDLVWLTISSLEESCLPQVLHLSTSSSWVDICAPRQGIYLQELSCMLYT